MKAKSKAKAKAPDNLVMFPGCFVVDYHVEPCLGDDKPQLLLARGEYLATFGIHDGMVIVARESEGEPPDNAICVLEFERKTYLKRVRVKRTKRGRVNGYYLSDDTAEKLFGKDEVRIEAVALYACSCEMKGSRCEPVYLSGERFTDPRAELGEEWERFISEEGGDS